MSSVPIGQAAVKAAEAKCGEDKACQQQAINDIIQGYDEQTQKDLAFVAGVGAGLVENAIKDAIYLTQLTNNPIKMAELALGLKELLTQDDVLGQMSESVRQEFLRRIDVIEGYGNLGQDGAFKAGQEIGNTLTDLAAIYGVGKGVASGVEILTQKLSGTTAKSIVKAPVPETGKGVAGNNISHLTTEQQQVIKNAENISTAKPGTQVTTPRDLNEQVLWKHVQESPTSGRVLEGMNNDPRFPESAGFQKMEAVHKLPDGSSVTIHYQYNSNTGKAYDMKITTPKPNWPQPGISLKDN